MPDSIAKTKTSFHGRLSASFASCMNPSSTVARIKLISVVWTPVLRPPLCALFFLLSSPAHSCGAACSRWRGGEEGWHRGGGNHDL